MGARANALESSFQPQHSETVVRFGSLRVPPNLAFGPQRVCCSQSIYMPSLVLLQLGTEMLVGGLVLQKLSLPGWGPHQWSPGVLHLSSLV